MLRYRNIWVFVLWLLVFLLPSCKFQKILRSTSTQEKYDAALAYYADEDYYRAGVLLDELIPLLTGTKEYETAQFYYAYCQYHQNQLMLSGYYFEKFYQTFGRSTLAEEALYMHAVSLYENASPSNLDQTTTYEAINAAQNFLNTFRNSQYKERCEQIIFELRDILEEKSFTQANLYSKLNDYKAAVIAFENFQKDFPDSEFAEEATYMKLLNQYRLAKQSTERRKEERYNQTVTFYWNLVDKYPESKFLKEAEQMYNESLNALSKIRSTKL